MNDRLVRAMELKQQSTAWAREVGVERMARNVARVLGKTGLLGEHRYQGETLSILVCDGTVDEDESCEVRLGGTLVFRSDWKQVSVSRPGQWVAALKALDQHARELSGPAANAGEARVGARIARCFAPVE